MATKKVAKAKTYYIFTAYDEYEGWCVDIAPSKKGAVDGWKDMYNRTPVDGFFITIKLKEPENKEEEYPVYEIES